MMTEKKVSVVGKFRSSSGAWTEYTFPIWVKLDGLDGLLWARRACQLYLNEKREELGFVPRTLADVWLQSERPEWVKRLGNDFDRIMMTYALCLEPRAVKFDTFEWPLPL